MAARLNSTHFTNLYFPCDVKSKIQLSVHVRRDIMNSTEIHVKKYFSNVMSHDKNFTSIHQILVYFVLRMNIKSRDTPV